MRAEERLEQHRHVVTVLNPDGTWCKENQNHIVDACEAYDIGKQAIALLRELSNEWNLEHGARCVIYKPRPRGDEEWNCDCGAWDIMRRIDKYLEGGD